MAAVAVPYATITVRSRVKTVKSNVNAITTLFGRQDLTRSAFINLLVLVSLLFVCLACD